MAASFVVAILHPHPMVKVPLARGTIFPLPKVTTHGRVALGYVPNEVLGWGSCSMGFAMEALAWSSLLSSSSSLQSEGSGFPSWRSGLGFCHIVHFSLFCIHNYFPIQHSGNCGAFARGLGSKIFVQVPVN